MKTAIPPDSDQPAGESIGMTLGKLDGRVLDLLPVAVYFCDHNGVVVQWNRRAVELWGSEPKGGDHSERYCGSHKLYRLDGTLLAHADCPVAEVLRTGLPQHNVEVIVERADGSRRVALANVDALRDESGAVIGAVNILQDISKCKQAEMALPRGELLFRRLLDNLPAGGYTCDANGHITYYNERAVELWGREPKLNDPADRYCGSFRLFSADGAPIVHDQCWMALALRNQKEYDGQEIIFERPDGTRRFVLAHASPFQDEAGQVIGAVNILVDVTAHLEAEWALERTAAQLRLVTDHAPVLLVHCDRDARFLFVNKPYADRLSVTPQDIIGRRIPDVIGEKAYATFRRYVELTLTGQHVEFEVEIPYENIGPQIMRCSCAPDLGIDGQVRGMVAVLADVTERKRAQVALQESEQRFARFMQHLPGPAWIKDTQGRYVYANDAAEKAFSMPRAVFYGKTDDEVFPPEVAARFNQNDRQAVASRCGIQVVETLEHDDGTLHYSLVTKFPIQRADGEVKFVGGMAIDVTDQKRAEAELQDARSRLDAALEAGAIVTWTWDIANNRLFSDDNLAHLFNLPTSEAEGGSLDNYIQSIHPDDWPRVSAALNDSVKGGGDYEADYRIMQPDGSVRWVVARGRVQRDGRGQPMRMPGVLVEITERKRLEAELQIRVEQLAEADRRKEELLGSLRASEEKLRLLADTIPQLAWMANPDGDIFWYNRRWYDYTGTTFEEMQGWGWQSVHDPTLLPKVLERWKGAIASGEPFEMVFPLRAADGSLRSFLTRVNPLQDHKGNVIYWFGTNTDIEDEKQSQEALADSEKRFRQLADAMPQIVWTARPDGQIEYMNRQWHAFTGLPETLGNEGWAQILHPHDAPRARELWSASVHSGAPFEMQIRLLDRSQQAYRWHLIRTVAVYDEAGRVVRWFGTSTDIHEQKRAEESSRYLAEASANLARVVDYESTLQKVATLAVPYFADWAAVDVVDGDGTLRRLAVAHQDSDKVALVHQLMREYPPDPQSPTGALAVLRTGEPQIFCEIPDQALVRAAKDEHHLSLIRSLGLKSYICVPLVASGKPMGVLTFATAESGRRYSDADLALAMDLAQRAGIAVENTRLYQALREADRRKDEFLATLAHELRNPLAPIRSSLQILNMPRVDAETARQSREMMERQVHHLVRLVDDLLDVSRVMRGKIELRWERVELASVVARAVETVQPFLNAQGHHLTIVLPTESLPLAADPVRLAQVVGNLLTNAAKYTERGGRIWLTAERDDCAIVLRVRDNGIGIATEMLPRIFELFVQVDHASTKAQGGLGIGLTLVKNLVELHGGTVEACSEGLGRGSEFVVRLQIASEQFQTDRLESEPSVSSIGRSGHRLLVVDDNQDAAVSLAMLLKLQGHEVRLAHSGQAALEMMKSYVPDVVFLDIGMPGMDGYEVARQIRQQPGLESVVLAALTGWGQQEDRRRTAEAGFNHHLVKPLEPNALESVLAALRKRNNQLGT